MKVANYISLGLICIDISNGLQPHEISMQVTSHGILLVSFMGTVSYYILHHPGIGLAVVCVTWGCIVPIDVKCWFLKSDAVKHILVVARKSQKNGLLTSGILFMYMICNTGSTRKPKLFYTSAVSRFHWTKYIDLDSYCSWVPLKTGLTVCIVFLSISYCIWVLHELGLESNKNKKTKLLQY